jgi:hypothetical protein
MIAMDIARAIADMQLSRADGTPIRASPFPHMREEPLINPHVRHDSYRDNQLSIKNPSATGGEAFRSPSPQELQEAC